jgi:large subunit ribosomal protein L2
MAIKLYKPTTNGRRGMSGNAFVELTTDKPFKKLTAAHKSTGGRNSLGRTTSRFRGGGHKRRLRIVDFRFTKMDVPSVVQTIEYDPHRSAFISLVKDADGEHRYVVAHSTMNVGDTIITSANAKPIAGNRLKIGNIPAGLMVHNVELIIGRGAQAVRSAGASAQIVSQEGEYTQLKLNSTEVRLVHKECFATVGVVSNGDHNQIVVGKAGRSRWKGRRPHNLGTSMNPVDHPHGG